MPSASVNRFCKTEIRIGFAPADVIGTTIDRIKFPGSKDVEDAGATWENPALVN
jgi:hypothetical protein